MKKVSINSILHALWIGAFTTIMLWNQSFDPFTGHFFPSLIVGIVTFILMMFLLRTFVIYRTIVEGIASYLFSHIILIELIHLEGTVKIVLMIIVSIALFCIQEFLLGRNDVKIWQLRLKTDHSNDN